MVRAFPYATLKAHKRRVGGLQQAWLMARPPGGVSLLALVRSFKCHGEPSMGSGAVTHTHALANNPCIRCVGEHFPSQEAFNAALFL